MKNVFLFLFCLFGWFSSLAQLNDWSISVHTVSFASNSTIEQSLDSIKSLGLTKVDTYRGKQHLGYKGIDTLHVWLDKSKLNKVRELFKKKGVSMNHFGVIQGANEQEWRQIFEFARYMDIKLLISEPQYEHLQLVDQLSQEYGIPVGVHNHPVPTKYWHPSTFLTYAKKLNLSKNIGIYPDINNWMASGLDPLEMLKLCKGRVIGIQLKDRINRKGMVPWGTGEAMVSSLLLELKSQGFDGNISFEYFGKFSKLDYFKRSLNYYQLFQQQNK